MINVVEIGENVEFYKRKRNIIILAIICCILWGSAYPAIKIGYELFNINDVGSKLIFAGIRFSLAGLVVLIYNLIMTKKIMFNKKDMMSISILGIMQTTLQYFFFYIGMSNTTGSKGSIINGMSAFFSIILSHFIYKNDKLNKNKIYGCLIGFIGIVIVNIDNSIENLFGSFSIFGEGFVAISTLLVSISAIYSKKITKDKDTIYVTGYQLFIGGLLLIVFGKILGGKIIINNMSSVLLLGYMVIISSVAFALWTNLIKYNKVGVISIYNFLIPVFGTILSGIFLKENIFKINILVSLLFVSVGIILINIKERFN